MQVDKIVREEMNRALHGKWLKMKMNFQVDISVWFQANFKWLMESIYIAYTATFTHSHSHPCCILEIAFRITNWLPFRHFSQGHFDGGVKERWSNYWFSILWAPSTFWARVSTAAQKALKYRFHFNDSYELQILHYSKALLPKEVVIMHFQKVL